MARATDADSKSLELVFETALGSTKTIVIYDQNDDIDKATVQAVGQYFITNNFFDLGADSLATLKAMNFHTNEYVPVV